MNKFYNFSGSNSEADLYLYGAIVSDKWCEDDVDFKDFKNKIEELNANSTLNVYVNSPGGEVFTTQSIISLLKRAKLNKNITLNFYIDGLGASCASWLPMLADNLYIYDGSMLMLHKPMTYCFGANANDLRKEIELLDKLEDSEMIPMYMSKAKEGVTEDDIRNMLTKETWLTSKEIEEYFNVTLLEDSRQLVACVDNKMFKNYKNVPSSLLENKEVSNKDKELDKLNKEIEIDLELIKIQMDLM